MEREERLEYLARIYYELNERKRDYEKTLKEYRSEIFKLFSYEFSGTDYILPVRTIEVPFSFWESTKMTKEEFVLSRFPGWILEHIERNIATKVDIFILKRDPDFIGTSITTDSMLIGGVPIRIAKEINEMTPVVDWVTLERERPDLFDILATPKVSYEMNEQKLEELMLEGSDVLSVLARHLKVSAPQQRITARKIKNEEK